MSDLAAIEIKDFTLRAGGRPLLENASMRVEAGTVVLLVGLSGSGKSLTLRLLLGLDDPSDGVDATGTLHLFGEDAHTAAPQRAGIVFQDFGLFDEWNAADNIRFGIDHRRRPREGTATDRVGELVRELGLEHAGRVATLSGGMKQRTALARTLAFDPDIVFYDEPTSGLDPARAAQVAARIRSTNDAHGKTSLVVTHDLETLEGIADRIILLDPERRTFREIAKSETHETLRLLSRWSPPTSVGEPAPEEGLFVRMAAATGEIVEICAKSVAALWPRYPQPRWGLRYFWYYFRLTTLGTAIPYVALCGVMLGLLVTYFTFSFLPFKQYIEPLLMDRIVSGLGYAIYRIMAPAMTALLIAARNGAAIAADIGNRVYSRQTDALTSFGVKPERYFLTNILWAFLLGAPILFVVNFLLAHASGLLVFAFIHPEQSTFFWKNEFPRFLEKGGFFWDGTLGVLVKTLISAFGIAAIAWHQGMKPKTSGRDVARAVTQTIIWSTLYALAVHLVATFVEFDPI